MSALLRAIVLVLVAAAAAQGQTLSSGSNGSDGALTLTTPGVVMFDPVALGLDTDRDNVFHFTTITIGAGVTVKMPFNALQGLPVVWLAQGAVQIDGTIDLDGQDGAAANPGALNRAAVAGPGGYPGGVGSGGPGFIGTNLRAGMGPGGANRTFINFSFGDHAGHAEPGVDVGGGAGAAYGNALLVPLRGGSGGGGGGSTVTPGGSGGAGGGALRVFSSTSIVVNGAVSANGGRGGSPPSGTQAAGGGGSGGGIHLIAPSVAGTGTLSVLGGGHGLGESYSPASRGRIRVDATVSQFTGVANGLATVGAPYNVPPPAPMPVVRVTTIAGIAVSPTPTGDAATPDATINQSGPVTVGIEARNVPLGTVLQVRVMSGAIPDFVVDSTPLSGTVQSSTATASVTFPPGFSTGLIRATWEPPTP